MAVVESAFGVVLSPGIASTIPAAKRIWDLVKKYRVKRRIFYFLLGKKEEALIKKQPLILKRIFGKSLDKIPIRAVMSVINIGEMKEREMAIIFLFSLSH
jgi:hypothetical protein